MKITFFRLKGYINILNGMGLDELIIPFNTFRNRIVLISGQNGTGKSTIIQALSPNPDSSDSFRTDVFIDEYGNRQIIEYPAEKEIWYSSIDDEGNHEFRILIQSIVDDSKTRRTTKAFISKDGEEMNPNGNVSSFKEIRDSLLGIDPVYLDLSSISSEHRGIVDMIPSERRKYMASYIGSLDTYNNIFKTISKKSTSLKSYLNTLNTKLYELGNETELRLKQMSLESDLKDLNSKRDKLLKNISEAETTVRLLDPDNKIQDLYASISERLGTIKFELEQNTKRRVYLYTQLGLDAEIANIGQEIENAKKILEDNNKTLNENNNAISSLISVNDIANKSLDEDRGRLSSIESVDIQNNIEDVINDLRSQKEEYLNYLTKDDIKILESTSIDEIRDFKSDLDNFIEQIKVLEERYDHNIFTNAASRLGPSLDELSSSKRDMESHLDMMKAKSSQLELDIASANHDLDMVSKFNDSRPKECKIDDCPYISDFVSLKSNCRSKKEIDKMYKDLGDLKIDIENMSKDLNDLNKVMDILTELKHLYSSISGRSIIKKIKSLSFLSNVEKVIDRLVSHNRFNEFSILNSVIEKHTIWIDAKNIDNQLKGLESDLKLYQNNKNLIDSLTKSISEKEEEINNRNNDIIRLGKENRVLEESISSMTIRLENLEKYAENEKSIEDCNNRRSELKAEFDAVKEKIKTVKDKVDSLNSLKDELSNVDSSINPLRETINEIKYNLANMVGYQEELKNVSEKYDKITFIRNACSPGNGKGIQSEYIKRYMNDIIIDCNMMLSHMFGGAIQLDIPIINEKQFTIPFMGLGGLMVPDISNGSTAQRCMIGLVFSCVAMMKSSTRYNIPRFDEIDGGLDSDNRVTFIAVLNTILDFMKSEQCIICSHNSEFESYSTTRIYTRTGGINIEQ